MIKTLELTGAALNWAVAKAEGEGTIAALYYDDEGLPVSLDEAEYPTWEPSINWAQAGPIIHRQKIEITPDEASSGWLSRKPFFDGDEDEYIHGPTPLIAAMRCCGEAK
jgi:hypothetical protein